MKAVVRADGQVERPGGPRRQRDGHDLAALIRAGDGQSPVPALEAQVLDVGVGGFRYAKPVQREQRDQRLLVEDLAVTMLLNSRVAARAATSTVRHGATVELGSLPNKALEDKAAGERQTVARVIGSVAGWPGLGASPATKTLHKKLPALIPVLDNQAIFARI
jgi:hypothetical protein